MALEDATNPLAGTSGPGRYAKRTDLQYQPTEYGAGVEMAAQKAGAPLASTPDVNGATNTAVRQAAASTAQQSNTAVNQAALTSLYDQSNRPHEPITHGINIGPGAGAEALNMPDQAQSQYTNAYQMIQQWASNPDASPTLQYLAQRIQQGF
jgi:hypothetical protein